MSKAVAQGASFESKRDLTYEQPFGRCCFKCKTTAGYGCAHKTCGCHPKTRKVVGW